MWTCRRRIFLNFYSICLTGRIMNSREVFLSVWFHICQLWQARIVAICFISTRECKAKNWLNQFFTGKMNCHGKKYLQIKEGTCQGVICTCQSWFSLEFSLVETSLEVLLIYKFTRTSSAVSATMIRYALRLVS